MKYCKYSINILLIIATLLMTNSVMAADAANDLLITQRNSGNTGNVQRNITATTNTLLGFNGTTLVNITAGSNITISGGVISSSGGGGGGVSSVDVSGGTTGLTTSGGPITTSGTITIAGVLIPANGGLGLDNSAATGVPLFTAGTAAITGTSGTGNFARVTNPVFTTPNIGSATGSISGNAGSATILQVAKAINGVSFDGSAAITITAAASTLTGTTLASNVVTSSLTSVGTLTSLTTSGTITATGASPGTFDASTGMTVTSSTSGNWHFNTAVDFIGSTTSWFEIPSLTTTQKNALNSSTPINGMLVYDSTLGRFQAYDAAAWHSYVRLDGDAVTGNLTTTGTFIMTSTAAAALVVGANGATNPAFSIDASTASSTTGIIIKSAANGGGVTITGTSGQSADNFFIVAKSTGQVRLSNGLGNSAAFQNTSTQFTIPSAASSGVTAQYSFTGKAVTAQTAGTEALAMDIDFSQVMQHASNTTVALQRAVVIRAPTYSFASATGTVTEAATFVLTGAPQGGTNSAVTTTYGLLIQAGAVNAVTTPTNAIGFKVLNPTGATNNYAALIGTNGTAMTNIRHGISGAMTLGTVTVTDTACTANTRYFFTAHTIGTVTVPSSYYASTRTASTSFIITSSQNTDTSTVDWLAIEP